MTASPDRYVSTRDRAAPTGAPLQVPSLDPTVVAPCQVPSLDLAIDAHAGVPTVVGADTTDAREAQPQSATVDLGTRRRRSQARQMATAALLLTLVLVVGLVTSLVTSSASASRKRVTVHSTPIAGNRGGPASHQSSHLAPATSAPVPAPPSLAAAAPLQSHEVFGYAPYWTLPQSASFDVKNLTTLAYFSVDANGDGTLDQGGSGWNGYESQDLVNLVNRAHAAGDRVVLTITCFSQRSLDQITSDPNAPARLSAALVAAVKGKSLDGVNFDFEGQGSADQAGLTNLITKVSAVLHATDPHWQVTMAVYGSAASDSGGFYNVATVAPALDAFFVMAYDMNSRTKPSATSPLFGAGYTDARVIEDFLKVVPPSKIVLGLPYYGYDWPTTDGSAGAAATGSESPLSDSVISAGHHQTYWDPVARDILRRSDVVGAQSPAGQLLPHCRRRHLGPRDGWKRPGLADRTPWQCASSQRHIDRSSRGHRIPDRRYVRRGTQCGTQPGPVTAARGQVAADRIPRRDRHDGPVPGLPLGRPTPPSLVLHHPARSLRGHRHYSYLLRSSHLDLPGPATGGAES